MRLRTCALVLLAWVELGCGAEKGFTAEPWPEANQLFQGDPRFMGADGAYSVDLGVGKDGLGRVLWMFGDTFVATDSARDKSTSSAMVRNAVALQTGYDPSHAFMRFYWGHTDGRPSSYVPEKGKHWFWPGAGIRDGQRLLLFYGQVHQVSEGMWGFDADGWGAFVVENPDDEPDAWRMTPALVPKANKGIELGESLLISGRHLLVYGRDQTGDDAGAYLARFELETAMAGDLRNPEWWTGDGWGATEERSAILDYAFEFIVAWSESRAEYLMTETSGAGATALSIRTADAPQGPWSERQDVFRPPESFRPGAFVYQFKGHPELTGADLVVTYVPSTFDDVPAEIGDRLYYPYFAKVTFP
jgi:hypothetical protein